MTCKWRTGKLPCLVNDVQSFISFPVSCSLFLSFVTAPTAHDMYIDLCKIYFGVFFRHDVCIALSLFLLYSNKAWVRKSGSVV